MYLIKILIQDIFNTLNSIKRKYETFFNVIINVNKDR
jgi:hypothetical protein